MAAPDLRQLGNVAILLRGSSHGVLVICETGTRFKLTLHAGLGPRSVVVLVVPLDSVHVVAEDPRRSEGEYQMNATIGY
jgi:hypothetical protein